MTEWKDPLPWLNDDLTLITRSSTVTETNEHDYLRFLEPTTLKSLEAWMKENNGNHDTKKTV